MSAQALMPLCIVIAAGQGLPSSKSLGHTGKKQYRSLLWSKVLVYMLVMGMYS